MGLAAVLSMANAAAVPEVRANAPAAKVSLGSLLVVCVVAVVLAVGGSAGALLFLAHSGKLGGASAASAAAQPKAEDVATKNVVLEPLLVNLADDGGHSYLRVSVVLAEAVGKDEKAKPDEKPVPGANAAVRDAILTVLSSKHAADLLAPNGKEELKKELKQAIDQEVPTAEVQTVYFTDFLVQQ